MSSEQESGLFHPRPRELVVRDLVHRARRRLEGMSDTALEDVLEDALWHERKRLGRGSADDPEHPLLDTLAAALVRGTREQRIDAALSLVAVWGDEIHGRFDPRVYRVATRVLPTAVTALLSRRPRRLRDWRPDHLQPNARVVVRGELEWARELSKEATLILAPTHVSNLDSPLIGLALYLAQLPPFVYGAGLNLFSNPVVGWWMNRLGAYTVDRTKRAALYKETLKDYSIRALTTRHHSLFFPGGTRARSGEIERKLKKGLLGTGIVAWQEMLAAGRPDSEVYVVPCTLSMTLVLEAATLIEDHLAEAGKSRYIITDDEFAQPRRLAAFANRVLDLDDAVVMRFGRPLDVLGNPVARDPEERRAQAERRRGYVCGPDGKVEWDDQRDHTYTLRLADALCDAYVADSEALPTNVAAYAAWRCIAEQTGSNDPFKVVRTPIEKRRITPQRYLVELSATLDRLRDEASQGRGHVDELRGTADDVLATALDRFGRYHRSRALVRRGDELVVEDPKLCLYYRNRLTWLDRAPRARPLGESK
ncbi:MAG: 1-acyl-sn-glycerol-3-phosphate acyltransferase [Alphaproteobacteria bacterium]|nr:1-acyl-sn-glycerol-3-phosphate acyltransferase [Alphaproteobacteria bacterium]MCB9698184.1 1-acyl-sn-glycerol-3-phosphate acyltransferase [Alphaproteobacteria bacterium]